MTDYIHPCGAHMDKQTAMFLFQSMEKKIFREMPWNPISFRLFCVGQLPCAVPVTSYD